MSRKKMVVGRASLSFPTPDGILDVDQILDTDPWKQIDNFVQHNFRQNVLDEFNERLKLNPTIAPSESKSPAKKQGTTSSRTPRKSGTAATKPKTNGGKSAAKEKKSVDRSKGPKEPKGKESAGRKEDGGKEVSKAKESKDGGGTVKGGEKKGEKQSKVTKESKCEKQGSQKLNSITKKNSMGISSARKEKENVVDVRASEKSIKGETTARKNDKVEGNAGEGNKSLMNSVDKSRSVISMSQLKTSTPKRNIAGIISSSIGKENAIARYNVSASKGDYSVRSDVSVKRMQCTSTICATSTDLNNNESKIEKKMGNKETDVAKLEHKNMILGKMKEETTLGSKEISRISMNEKKTLTLSCKKHDKKEASAEKKIGKYEKRLLERRERRRKRNIKRHERKAEQAMEEFSHHVTRIVKKMGYLSEFSSCSSSEDDVSSYSDSYDTYSESSKGSSYYYSYSSRSSCSCSSSSTTFL